MSESVLEYRARVVAEEFPKRYQGWLHLAFTSVGSLAVLVTAIVRVGSPAPLEWLVVPVTFLFANFVEYRAHRGPMHHPAPRPLRRLYERHALFHHRYFTEQEMVAGSSRDFYAVLFPPVMLFFFLGVVAAPIGLVLFLLASEDVAWLYTATAIGYFLTYEWLHFAYHQPPDGLIGRLPLVGVLRRHHALHHDLERMTGYNFNITFPICDAVFGTRWRTPPRAPPPVW